MIHLVGIGGIGLSAIARVLLARGVAVSGSDLQASPITAQLAQLGATIYIGQRAENLGADVDLVLVTSAAHDDNPEIMEARRRAIRLVKRSDFFPELTAGKQTIAIAGTHGKTTTTGMIAAILIDAGRDPDVIVGGILPELDGNARAGQGNYFVIEADEYDRAFLGLTPTVAVVTSIEMDHPDIYRDVDDVTQAFRQFIARVPQAGIVIGCGDAERVAQTLGARGVRYGFDAANMWRAHDVMANAQGGNDFVVSRGGAWFGEFSLQVPGRHNVLNALAAIGVTDQVGVDLPTMRKSLQSFRGAARRFQVRGAYRGAIIVDDYAHHPSEIRATLAAARARYPGRAIWAVFQPHTFSRTRHLLAEFANAFDDADHVIVTEIYAARERDPHTITGADVVARMTHRDARFIGALDACAEFCQRQLSATDVLLTLGAGDVNRVGEWLTQERGA